MTKTIVVQIILKSIKNGKDLNRVHYVDVTFPHEILATLIDTGATLITRGKSIQNKLSKSEIIDHY